MSEQNSNINNPVAGEKTFSQDEVNTIVQERLGREKTKLDTIAAEREQTLAYREFMLEAKETLQTKGLPLSLLDALNTSSKEAFEKSLEILEQNKAKLSPAPEMPPPYASGTGTAPVNGGFDENMAIRQGFGFKAK